MAIAPAVKRLRPIITPPIHRVRLICHHIMIPLMPQKTMAIAIVSTAGSGVQNFPVTMSAAEVAAMFRYSVVAEHARRFDPAPVWNPRGGSAGSAMLRIIVSSRIPSPVVLPAIRCPRLRSPTARAEEEGRSAECGWCWDRRRWPD